MTNLTHSVYAFDRREKGCEIDSKMMSAIRYAYIRCAGQSVEVAHMSFALVVLKWFLLFSSEV